MRHFRKLIFVLIFFLSVLSGQAFADSYLESAYYAVGVDQPEGFYLWIDYGTLITSIADGTTQKRLSYNLTTAGISVGVWHKVIIQPYSGTTTGPKFYGEFKIDTSEVVILVRGATVSPGHGTGTITPGKGTVTVPWMDISFIFMFDNYYFYNAPYNGPQLNIE